MDTYIIDGTFFSSMTTLWIHEWIYFIRKRNSKSPMNTRRLGPQLAWNTFPSFIHTATHWNEPLRTFAFFLKERAFLGFSVWCEWKGRIPAGRFPDNLSVKWLPLTTARDICARDQCSWVAFSLLAHCHRRRTLHWRASAKKRRRKRKKNGHFLAWLIDHSMRFVGPTGHLTGSSHALVLCTSRKCLCFFFPIFACPL